MKHRVLLRRVLPLAVLAAVLYSAGWPASAFFFQKDEAVPSVAAMTKNGPAAEPISFSEEDFVVEGSGKLDSIVITTLPDAAVGCLTLGAQGIQVGDVIAMEAVDGLRFTPLAAPAGLEAQFQFTPVFSDGRSGDAVTVELYLLAEANGAPVAENLELTTYKNVAVTAQFSAVDPEGDLLTYHILNKPARGAVTMPEDGSSEFVYTPYENKTGKDSFTYVAVDAVGNSSDPATVKFQFTPVFSDGRSGDAVTVELYLLAEANGAPVAENLELTTYKNVAVTAQFSAVDPEGDLLTYHILNKPARGAVTMPEDGSSEFVYTPYENKTGKDSFTYVAVDAVGNSSDPATVKIKIEKPNTKVTYADMDGDPAHKAAIRLAEEGIFVGECMGGAYFFQPDAAVTRGEFVAMAMNAAGMEALEDVERTGFADDVSIPTWAKPYVSSALKAGLVQGSRSSDGQVVFQAEEPITAAEAAVLLDRALQVTDVSADTLAEEGIPTWAAQSAANLATCGVLSLDGGLSAPLTRGEAAELLCGALELQDSRDGGWF